MEIHKNIKYKRLYTSKELEEYKNKAIDELRNDVEVYQKIKEMGALTSHVNEYLPLFLDFQEDYNYCKNCPGYANCKKEHKGTKLSLVIEGNVVERKITFCEPYNHEKFLNSQYVISDFPVEWRDRKFEKIKPLKSREALLATCLKALKSKNNTWIYVHGTRSSGKTLILITLINELVQTFKRGPVGVIDCIIRFKELNDLSFENRNAFNEYMEYLSNLPILLLDNFGSEYKNDYIRDTIIYPLLSNRRNNNLMTLFSSDYSLNDLKALYTCKGKQSEIMAKQLESLIQESSYPDVSISGKAVFN